MNNILSSKTNNAIFLAALLVLGTIATILPSIQAQPYYKDTYQPEYPSYGKDSYKSKDSSSVSINKLKCINNNVNINGNNTGDINVGNSGSSASRPGTDDEGYLGVGSSGGNYGEGYDNNGYKKQKDQRFTCIINNNNNTIVTVNATDDNETTPEVPLTCEECFEASGLQEEIDNSLATLGGFGIEIGSGEEITIPIEVNSI